MKQFLLTLVLTSNLFFVGQVYAQELDFSGMTGDEMIEDAEVRIVQMEDSLVIVLDLRNDTQADDGDVAKLRCINNSLAAIEGFVQLSNDAVLRLIEATGGADREGMEHQYSMVIISSQRVQGLVGEASQCAGDILTYAGSTEQQVRVDSDIPDEEGLTATADPYSDVVQVEPDEPLPEATPFQ